MLPSQRNSACTVTALFTVATTPHPALCKNFWAWILVQESVESPSRGLLFMGPFAPCLWRSDRTNDAQRVNKHTGRQSPGDIQEQEHLG